MLIHLELNCYVKFYAILVTLLDISYEQCMFKEFFVNDRKICVFVHSNCSWSINTPDGLEYN